MLKKSNIGRLRAVREPSATFALKWQNLHLLKLGIIAQLRDFLLLPKMRVSGLKREKGEAE